MYTGIIIHCPTEESSDALLEYLHSKGVRWRSGVSLNWDPERAWSYGADTCYRLDENVLTRDALSTYKGDEFSHLPMYSASDYLDVESDFEVATEEELIGLFAT